jgi:hypothetical protein
MFVTLPDILNNVSLHILLQNQVYLKTLANKHDIERFSSVKYCTRGYNGCTQAEICPGAQAKWAKYVCRNHDYLLFVYDCRVHPTLKVAR